MKKKKLTMLIWWVFWFIYLEIIFRAFVIGNLFTLSTLTVILFSLPWILVISILLNIFNDKANKVLNIIFTTFFLVFPVICVNHFEIASSGCLDTGIDAGSMSAVLFV